MSTDNKLVSPSDIAELAGRTRAAVSNWRANPRLSFPEPAGGTEVRPLFNLAEVETWLKDRQGITIEKVPGAELWSVFNSVRGQVDLTHLMNYVLGLMTLRKLAVTHKREESLVSAVRSHPAELLDAALAKLAMQLERSRDIGLVDTFKNPGINQPVGHLVATTVMSIEFEDLARAAEYLLGRALKSIGRNAGEQGYVGSRVSTILARAVATRGEPGVVYDPACGLAEALMQVANQSPKTTLLGDEVNINVARLAAQRAFLAGIDLDLTIGDSLAENHRADFQADVVIVESPLGARWGEGINRFDPRWRYGLPAERSGEFLWLQHALAHLKSGGVAFAITSMRSLFTGGADERVRQGLVEAGCVERIIALPGKLHPYTTIPLALWVLREPTEDRHVTFVDASDQAEFGDGKVVDRTEELLSVMDGSNVSTQSVTDIVIDGSNLMPSRWSNVLDNAIDDVAGDIDVKNRRLTDLLSAFSDATIPALLEHDQPRMERVQDLLSFLTIIVGRGREGEDNAVYSEPGDVILHTVSKLRSYVDTDGGRLLTGSIVALRLENDARLDPYYLAGVLTGGWNNRHFSGSAIMRVKPRELEIPVLQIADQRRLGGCFRRLASIRNFAGDLGTFLDEEYLPSLLTAVTAGYTLVKPEEASQTTPKVEL